MKKRILIVAILIVSCISFYNTTIYALKDEIQAHDFVEKGKKIADEVKEKKREEADTSISLKEAITGADEFLKSGEEKVYDSEMQKASGSLVNMFMAAGTVIAIVYIGILGIKYMSGSVEEKAEIKETLIPFIVGCVVVFAAFTIWKIAILIGSSFGV